MAKAAQEVTYLRVSPIGQTYENQLVDVKRLASSHG